MAKKKNKADITWECSCSSEDRNGNNSPVNEDRKITDLKKYNHYWCTKEIRKGDQKT